MLERLRKVIEQEREVAPVEALMVSIYDSEHGFGDGLPLRVSGVPVWAHAQLHQGEYAVVRKLQ